MNDFTKDELELIKSGLDAYWITFEEHQPVLEKLQSLIDNSCDHESDSCQYPVKGCDSSFIQYKCKHCGEFYNELL